MTDDRAQILYLRPGMDVDRLAQATMSSLARLDGHRWASHLIVTEPSPNRLLHRAEPLVEEAWDLPDQMAGEAFPEFILGFIESRGIQLLNVAGARLGFDLLPDIASLRNPPAVVVCFADEGEAGPGGHMRYAARRYGDLIDAFEVAGEQLKAVLAGYEIPVSRIELEPADPADPDTRLYERLLEPSLARGHQPMVEPPAGTAEEQSSLRLQRRPPPDRTVSVGVTCHRAGAYLDECIHSIKLQFLRPRHIVVVDVGSDDPETLKALERCDSDSSLTVVREAAGLGRGAARNRALEAFDTNYALWIDAGDTLLPGALDSMIARLEEAPEDIGFVYPHVKHSGNRSDYVEAPAYNLWLLMQREICSGPALYDLRSIRGAGVTFPEDLGDGLVDWDLALRLAERGIRGQPADGPTFLRRASGIRRADVREPRSDDARRIVELRHPALYLDEDRIKAGCAPALSIVLWGWDDADREESGLRSIDRQSCRDFELLAAGEMSVRVRMVERGTTVDWLQAALREARGRWVCVLTPAAAPILENTAFVEQQLRCFGAHEPPAGVALYSAPELARPSLSRLSDRECRSAGLVGVTFDRGPGSVGAAPVVELVPSASALESLVSALSSCGNVQSRLVASGSNGAEVPTTNPALKRLELNRKPAGSRSEATTRRLIAADKPRLRTLAPGAAPRWGDLTSWMPSDTQPLCRHRHLHGPTRIVTCSHSSPPGFRFELDLGVVHSFALPGAKRLIARAGTFELSDEQDEPAEGRSLGYIEDQHFPLGERLDLCRMPESGERVLVAGRDDPLRGVATPIAPLGYVQSFPIKPRDALLRGDPIRVATLYRQIDDDAGRHRYSVETPTSGSAATALGSLLNTPVGDLVALRRRDDGRLATDLTHPGRPSRHPVKLARWVAAPPASDAELYRSAGGRVKNLVRRRPGHEPGLVLGWLGRAPSPGTLPLFSTTHFATGDQLVTRDLNEAARMDYRPDGILGFALAMCEGENPDTLPPTHTAPRTSA